MVGIAESTFILAVVGSAALGMIVGIVVGFKVANDIYEHIYKCIRNGQEDKQ